jgi:TonB family protein
LEERIDLSVDVEERRRPDGVGIAVAASLVVHTLLIIYVVATYKPLDDEKVAKPIVRYVELMRQNRDFTEAPGPKQEKAPMNAPFSDANRKASMPKPTGDEPTTRPGQGSSIWTPPSGSPTPQAQQGVRAQQQQTAQQGAQPTPGESAAATSGAFSYRQPVTQAAAGVDWRNAIREVGKVASLGGAQGIDLGGAAGGGGDKGFAESGPISFETAWYDWGEYAESMVSKIRVNWYGIMPELIRTGLKGRLTIRFTIHRDGRITDVTIIEGSTIPPYDFAAKKAIEMSSPLNPLPKDFPKETERVTAMFFYNEEPPRR